MRTELFQGLPIKIDRPKGTIQTGTDKNGRPWKRVYSYDYGFFPKTEGGDGDETDVFIGPSKDAHMTFWAVQTKDDGEFDEFKVFVGFNSRKEAVQAYVQHIPRKYLKSMLAIPISMVKSMLGKKPLQKVASAAFFDELEKLGGA